MIIKIVNKINNFFVKLRILTKKGIHISKDIELRDANCIEFNGECFIGSGSKLLCWKEYTSGKKKQKLNPHIKIGDNFHATRNFVIQSAGNVIIGNNVLVASNVFIIDFNHGMLPITDNYLDNNLEVSRVVIKDGTWIGNNVIILPGVTIGKHSIIGAGSVVTKNIPEYSIAAGNPARVIKKYSFIDEKWIKFKS